MDKKEKKIDWDQNDQDKKKKKRFLKENDLEFIDQSDIEYWS